MLTKTNSSYVSGTILSFEAVLEISSLKLQKKLTNKCNEVWYPSRNHGSKMEKNKDTSCHTCTNLISTSVMAVTSYIHV